jgi:hypothetical protein
LPQHIRLDVQVLNDRFDNQTGARKGAQTLDGMQPGQSVLAILCRQLAARDESLKIGSLPLAARLCGAGRSVVQQNGVPGRRSHERDAAAHRAGTDYGH